MIEAMACGTPVIAYPSGSVCEVLEHGLTGLIVRDETAAADAIEHQLSQLSHERIVARFKERFTARRMADDYVEVYRALAAGARRPLRTVNGARSTSRTQDGRHQTGMHDGLYIAD